MMIRFEVFSFEAFADCLLQGIPKYFEVRLIAHIGENIQEGCIL